MRFLRNINKYIELFYKDIEIYADSHSRKSKRDKRTR